jgi:hypothetical protein
LLWRTRRPVRPLRYAIAGETGSWTCWGPLLLESLRSFGALRNAVSCPCVGYFRVMKALPPASEAECALVGVRPLAALF